MASYDAAYSSRWRKRIKVAQPDQLAQAKEWTMDDLHSDVQPAGCRVPLIWGREDIENYADLDDEEREVLERYLVKHANVMQAIHPTTVAVLAHDPKLALHMDKTWRSIQYLVDDGAYDQIQPGTILNLMTLRMAKHYGAPVMQHTLAACAAHSGRMTPIVIEKLMMIDYPDSDVWDHEERLAIRYADAVLTNSMTDGLWASAVETWGVKQSLRYSVFLAEYLAWQFFQGVVNLTGHAQAGESTSYETRNDVDNREKGFATGAQKGRHTFRNGSGAYPDPRRFA